VSDGLARQLTSPSLLVMRQRWVERLRRLARSDELLSSSGLAVIAKGRAQESKVTVKRISKDLNRMRPRI
jgi:hypothetical protein